MPLEPEESPEELDIVWSEYGLKQSPYSTSPMRLFGRYPIGKVFSGRTEEVDYLEQVIRSSNSTRALIAGKYGVGKTTFANYVKWKLVINEDHSQYLTTSAEIKVQPEWTAQKFLLATLSSIYSSSKVFDWKSKGIELPSLGKVEEYVSITTDRSFQGSAAGFGGGYGESTAIPSEITPEILESLLHEILQDVRNNNKELIVQYNNLENLENQEISDLLRSIRDYLQMEGFHALFLGPPSIISAVERYGQVHSVFQKPLILQPLSEENVLEILEKRCKFLKFDDGEYIKPYEDTTVTRIYDKLNQNIRFTFKVLEDATLMTEQSMPGEVTMEQIMAVQEKEKEKILSTLTDTQTKILTALIDSEELSQTELSERTGISRTNLTEPVQELKGRGLVVVRRSEEDKRYKYVRLAENSYLKLYFSSDEAVDDEQTKLSFT